MEYHDYLDEEPDLVVVTRNTPDARELFNGCIDKSPQQHGFKILPYIKVVMRRNRIDVYSVGYTMTSLLTLEQIKQLMLVPNEVRRILYDEFSNNT